MGALTSLEVLDLYYCSGLVELPSGIEKWISLRQLNLWRCESLTHLPSGMGALTSLEVLDLDYCSGLVELPSGIEKLVNLRHLKLEGCYELAQIPSGIGALLPACTPCMFIVGDSKFENTSQLEELGPLSDLPAEMIIKLHDNILLKSSGDEEAFLLNKKSLRKLIIEYRHNILEARVINNHREVLGKLQPSNHLEEFILSSYQDTMFPGWMPERGFASVLPNIVTLEFVNCIKCQYLPSLSGLVCLRSLKLSCLSSLEYIEGGGNVSEAPFGLPNLEMLSLYDLPKLKAWCRGLPIEVGDNDDYKHDHSLVLHVSFPRLSHLSISRCLALTDPTLLSFLQPFQLNKDLSCKTQDTTSPFHCIGSEFLLIEKKDSLEMSIYDILNVEAFNGIIHYVTHLSFTLCSQLKTFPLPGMQQLTALRWLDIRDCPDFTGEKEEEEMQSDQHPHISWKELQILEHLTLSELPKMVKLPEGIQFLTSVITESKTIKTKNNTQIYVVHQIGYVHGQREIRFLLETELQITTTARVYIATTLPELGRMTSAQYTK